MEVAQEQRYTDAQAAVRDAAKAKSQVPVWREGLARQPTGPGSGRGR